MVDMKSQADPKFQSTFLYARVSARAVREELVKTKGYDEAKLPSRETIGAVLNRMGYRLKKTQKTKPLKKLPETDAIFENVFEQNQASADNPRSLQISIDSKAKVKIGNPSRDGKARSDSTQFIKRMVELSKKIDLKIRLVYYPPYHSKYNPIERCWAALENYWHGTILDSVDAAVAWASNMTWKSISPIVHLVETTYEKGVKVLPEDLKQYFPSWQRSDTLPKWDITIVPN
jgi:hypothetical protein